MVIAALAAVKNIYRTEFILSTFLSILFVSLLLRLDSSVYAPWLPDLLLSTMRIPNVAEE